MRGTHTTSTSDQVPEAEAAVDRLREHLVAEGISPTLIYRVTDGPEPDSETAPQLMIYGEAGGRAATVAVGRGWLLITCVIGFAVVRSSYQPDVYGKGLLHGFVGQDPQVLADKIAGQSELQASLTAISDAVAGRRRR
jgi:hypothetical protein